MEKLKVNKDVFEALGGVFVGLRMKEEDFHKRLMSFVSCKSFSDNYQILNDLTSCEVAQIILFGYELEKTTEDLILERFNKDSFAKHEFNEGFKSGMVFTLNLYGHKVEGVND